MKLATLGKLALVSSVGLLALMVAAPVVASAAPGSANVPCTQTALVAAITAANTAGGGTINLARCHYFLTTANDSENGLPVVTTPIGVNGNGATIRRQGHGLSDLRGRGPGGNLTLNNVTVTGGRTAT